MSRFIVVVLAAMLCGILCKPLEKTAIISADIDDDFRMQRHSLRKRFVNPELTFGSVPSAGFSRMRTKRSSEEDCEKLQLCKLHARSSRNFLAAFELYFVNKENAKLWDHHSHTMAYCHRTYHCSRK